jgi:hypothetical protein
MQGQGAKGKVQIDGNTRPGTSLGGCRGAQCVRPGLRAVGVDAEDKVIMDKSLITQPVMLRQTVVGLNTSHLSRNLSC